MNMHASLDTKFCHFFNNDKFCQYEEHGCMFKHEHAPLCTRKGICRVKLCQFKHQNKFDHNDISSFNDDKIGRVDNEIEIEDELTEEIICEKCTFMSIETVYHKNDDIQACSQCEFETYCKAAYNEHWASTPGHIFPSEKLRTMTFSYN